MSPGGDQPDPSGQPGTSAAWQGHLRRGGVTPWADYRQSGAGDEGIPSSAVHLELVRRLDSGLPRFTDLADLVLATPAPGRGSVDVPLWGAAQASYGTPAVDPAQLSYDELLRLAASILAGLVLRLPAVDQPARRVHWWARRFRVTGAPVVREQVRAALLARGWQEAAYGGTHIVIGAPVADGFAQVWAHRVAGGSAAPWTRVWKRQRNRDEMPMSLCFAELAEQAQGTGGRVLTAVGTMADASAQMGDRLGLRLPGAIDLVGVDLSRRVNAVLAVKVPHDRQTSVRTVLADVVGRSENPVTQLEVPVGMREWAARLPGADGTGYAHPQAGVPDQVPIARTLDLALRAIGRAWTKQVAGEGKADS